MCQIAPGEDDTWNARCHANRLHVSSLLEGGHVGGESPPSIKVCYRKKKQRKENQGKE